MEYRTINPATGELVETFDNITDDDLERAIATAQSTYEEDWRHRPVAERATILRAAAKGLRSHGDYASYLTLEVGKLAAEAQVEVELAASILDYYADHGEEFLQPKDLPEAPGAMVYTEPIGVILGIQPWNFPYYQVARVAAAQLIAGNVVLVKHAESVPQSALALQRIFDEAGVPTGAYTNIFATHDQIGRTIDDPRIAGVTVTGSERTGSAVAERAGRAIKKVVMELGGSDPLIVLEDADLERSVESALIGRMINNGQTCVASKRIIVVGHQRGEKFLAAFRKGLDSLTAGDPASEGTTLGPLSSERALEVLTEQVQAAQKNGATILRGGSRIDRPGFYFEPTILTGIDSTNPAYAEEFFGPVAAFYVVESEEEAIALANATPYGLGASVFTEDISRGRAVARQVESGMVFINQPAITAPELPFGGIKKSGFGRELSEDGLGEFVNRKLVSIAPDLA
ncbi:succinate-semialdehyde dehydrogenase [Streptomyces maremycinicus]|nr:succinate-semialdehyde dehydrogenase [Streptomyces sp. B9173]